jgi:hypothetical protein
LDGIWFFAGDHGGYDHYDFDPGRDYIKENARRDAMSEDEINAKYTEDELGRSEPVLPLYTLGRIVPSLGETG